MSAHRTANEPKRSEVTIRSREIYMSRQDVRAFLLEVADAFPEARYFDFGRMDEGELIEVPRDDPVVPDRFVGELSMYFVGPEWRPEIVPRDDEYRPYRFVNRPMPLASIEPAMVHTKVIEDVGWRITWHTPGLLNANHLRNDACGKRVIDKLFRVHRKLVDNKVVPVDLRTGEVAGEVETSHYWHGADMARQCLEKEDHYLFVSLDRDNDRFWGYKPVKVPGE